MNFSDRLKEARKNAGLTQAQLSKKLGITAQSYSQYETGKRNPKFETVKKIAMALEIDVYDLLIDGDMTPREAMSILRNVDAKQYIENEENKTESEQKIKQRINQFETMAKQRVIVDNMIQQLELENAIKKRIANLNADGQKELLHQAELISKIPEYRMDNEVVSSNVANPDLNKGVSETETPDSPDNNTVADPDAIDKGVHGMDAPNQDTPDKNHSPRIRGQATT